MLLWWSEAKVKGINALGTATQEVNSWDGWKGKSA